MTGALAILVRAPMPHVAPAIHGPWWNWLGGVIGGLFVMAAIVLIPRTGAAMYLGAVITGQLIAAALIDSHGWLGMTPRILSASKVAGLVLIAGGVITLVLGDVLSGRGGTAMRADLQISTESRR